MPTGLGSRSRVKFFQYLARKSRLDARQTVLKGESRAAVQRPKPNASPRSLDSLLSSRRYSRCRAVKIFPDFGRLAASELAAASKFSLFGVIFRRLFVSPSKFFSRFLTIAASPLAVVPPFKSSQRFPEARLRRPALLAAESRVDALRRPQTPSNFAQFPHFATPTKRIAVNNRASCLF